MGGGGAMYYAARHPDLFAAAGSFSGLPLAFVNAAEHTAGATYLHDLQERCEADPTGIELFGVYGNPFTDEVAVRNSMPTELAPGLRGMFVYLSAGDGIPADDEQRALAVDKPDMLALEPLVRHHTEQLHERLSELAIDHVYDPLAGTHWWETFRPGLTAFVDRLFVEGFGRPTPASFDYRTADAQFSVWDWTFEVSGRAVAGFTEVRNASATGLQLRGAGSVAIVTAALFRTNEAITVDVDGVASPTRADRRGRVHLTVPLGDREVAVVIRGEGHT